MITSRPPIECRKCGGRKFHRKKRTSTFTVDGTTFRVGVPMRVCDNCGERNIAGADLQVAELKVAARLAKAGKISPDSFRFLRQALGLRSQELAQLLDVALESVSRWENGRRALDRSAWVLLATMVLEANDGSRATRDRLAALREPTPLPKTVRVE